MPDRYWALLGWISPVGARDPTPIHYPTWNVLTCMTNRGQKEAECMVHWGHWGSVYESDSEVDQSAMELVGYHMLQKEIRDIYQSIYLLQRAPGLPPCRTQPRRKAIQDILSSLKGRLHRCGCSAATRDQEPQEEEQVRPNWQGLLWRSS